MGTLAPPFPAFQLSRRLHGISCPFSLVGRAPAQKAGGRGLESHRRLLSDINSSASLTLSSPRAHDAARVRFLEVFIQLLGGTPLHCRKLPGFEVQPWTACYHDAGRSQIGFSPEELWSMSKRGNSERAPTAASDYTRQNEDKSRTTQRRRTDALRVAAEHCRLLQTKPATQAWPHRAAPVIKGGWCSGITPAQHAGGPGFNPQTVHFPPRLFVEWK